MRWFVAEFFVVVSGIVVALWLQAWWQGRQEASREGAYLRQMAADLRETERRLGESDRLARDGERAGALLVRAYYSPEAPPADSVLAWLRRANPYEAARPVTGTIEALVLTGDLNLIRDAGVRAAVTGYLDEARLQVETQQVFVQSFNAAADRVQRRINAGEIEALTAGQARIDSLAGAADLYVLPAGPRRALPPIDARALVRDRGAHADLYEMNQAKLILRETREQMRQSALRLRARLDSAR